MFFHALLTVPMMYAPVVLEQDAIESRSAKFRIPYRMSADAKAKADHIRLLVSTDQGKTWKHESDFNPGDDLKFHAPKDGLYWFAVEAVWKEGKKSAVGGRSASVKVFVNTQGRLVLRSREEAGLRIEAGGRDDLAVPLPTPGMGLWSKYGRLEETNLKCENGQPVYALKDGDKLITHVATNPGKSLADYVGRTIAVYGSTHTEAGEIGRYIVATHVAVP